MVRSPGRTEPPTLSSGDDRRTAPTPRRESAWRQRSCSVAAIALLAATICAAAFTFVSIYPPGKVIVGSPRAIYPAGKSDEDQIRDVLQAISDSYNRKDVKSAEDQLCSHVRSQWSSSLERVWMRYRSRHGPFRFVLHSIHVSGLVADVTGHQTYANDTVPRDFTASMARQRDGWKMCSST